MHTLKKKFEKGWSSPRKDVKLQIELSHRNCLDKFQIREMKLAGNGKAKLWAGKQDERNVLCLGLNSGVERLFCGFSREAEIGRCLVVRETQGDLQSTFHPVPGYCCEHRTSKAVRSKKSGTEVCGESAKHFHRPTKRASADVIRYAHTERCRNGDDDLGKGPQLGLFFSAGSSASVANIFRTS